VSDVRITQLDNGLRVATEWLPAALSVAAGAWVDVGSRDEPEVIAGVSHFLEHLLFKGTPTRSAQEIARAIDRHGGDFNAYTTKEHTAYYCRVPARHAAVASEVLGDILTRPALRDADVDSERQVILEELAMDDDAPDDVAMRTFTEEVFAGHPLGRDTGGSRETVASIGADDVRRFFADYYHAASMVVSIAGPLPHDEAVELVARSFTDVGVGEQRPSRTVPGDPGTGRTIDDDTEQVHILIGGRAVDRFDPDREALDVVNHVLGGGLSSRLFEEIREQRGLVYAVSSNVGAFSDSGAYQAYAGTTPGHAAEVIELIRLELRRLRDGGITAEELELGISSVIGSFQMGLEDTAARMARTGTLLSATGRVRPIEDQMARWAAVDMAAVERVIARVFTPEPLTVTVGPTPAD
jgi:predicted Zn-dependent peptidase